MLAALVPKPCEPLRHEAAMIGCHQVSEPYSLSKSVSRRYAGLPPYEAMIGLILQLGGIATPIIPMNALAGCLPFSVRFPTSHLDLPAAASPLIQTS